MLRSGLRGHRRALSDARLAWYGLKYPLLTLKVAGLIHWQCAQAVACKRSAVVPQGRLAASAARCAAAALDVLARSHAQRMSARAAAMIWFLRIAFGIVVVTMLCVTSWASAHVPLWETPRAVVMHPWFIATMFDTYFGFLTFFVWLAVSRNLAGRAAAAWLIWILLLGNIAMASYVLLIVWRLPPDAPVSRVLLRPAARGA